MKDEKDSADIPGSTGSGPNGSRGGFKPSAKLRARMEKLSDWRISGSSIKAPKDAREFHGGHATVSKAFLPYDGRDSRWVWARSYSPTEVMQLCRQSSESDDRVRGAADHQLDKEEYKSDSRRFLRGEFVAVKKSRIGDNKDLERVLGLTLRETEFLVEFDHENVVKLKGFVEDLSRDRIWLVFPWAENGNLKDFVASRDWEIPERISLINNVARGLEYLHRQEPPICHGDLKSFNVLVNSQHVAVITDFGSARRLTEHDLKRQVGLVQNQQQPLQAKFSTLSKTITLTGNIYTLRWAAPELLNDDQMSLWSDIWALGWIAYEVLTNSIPFQDVAADVGVIERVVKGDLPFINEHARVSLFENLCSLMTMCWNSNPSERPTAKNYLDTISDMPMVAPDTTNRPDSTFSSASSARALMDKGKIEQTSGDPALAFACFTEARGIYTRIGDRQGKANALSFLAALHLNRKEYGEAIAHYSEALKICTDIGDMEGRADALGSLADVHRHREEYSEAAELYSEALKIRTDIGDLKGRFDTLWSLADVHRLQNKYGRAIVLYSEALKIPTHIGNKLAKIDALWGLADVHRRRDEYSEALALYSEVLKIFTDVGDGRGKANTCWALADVYRLQKEYSGAAAFYYKALGIYTNIGDRRGRAKALWALADVQRRRGEYSEAVALYFQALPIRTVHRYRHGIDGARLSLGKVLRSLNK